MKEEEAANNVPVDPSPVREPPEKLPHIRIARVLTQVRHPKRRELRPSTVHRLTRAPSSRPHTRGNVLPARRANSRSIASVNTGRKVAARDGVVLVADGGAEGVLVGTAGGEVLAAAVATGDLLVAELGAHRGVGVFLGLVGLLRAREGRERMGERAMEVTAEGESGAEKEECVEETGGSGDGG